MIDQDDIIYQKLRKFMNTLPAGFPKTKTGVEIKILKRIFTIEEAAIFINLSYDKETIEEISLRINISRLTLEKYLDSMVMKGQVFRETIDDKVYYRVFHFIMGMYEHQINVTDKEFATYIDEYMPYVIANLSLRNNKIKQTRVIPINKSIELKSNILNYNDINSIIEEQDIISVKNCICRTERNLIGDGCGKPIETCFSFGSTAEYTIETKRGREISKDEALKMIKNAVDSGLVLLTSNTKEVFVLCCCCDCCCLSLKFTKLFGNSSESFKSSYVANINNECIFCNSCIEICPMDAIISNKEKYIIDESKCIGCGLCIPICPTETIKMINSKYEVNIPKDKKELLDTIKRGNEC